MQAQAFDQGPTAGLILLLGVVKKSATSGDHHEEATATVVVLLMNLKLLGQSADARYDKLSSMTVRPYLAPKKGTS